MIEPNFVNNYDATYTVSHACECGRTTTAVVPASAVWRWRQGAYVQEAFWKLTPDEREALFITGLCSGCWDNLGFEDED